MKARPGPHLGPLSHPPGQGDGAWWLLSQGLLEFEQARSALDDLSNHKAGGRRPQLVVGSWERHRALVRWLREKMGVM